MSLEDKKPMSWEQRQIRSQNATKGRKKRAAANQLSFVDFAVVTTNVMEDRAKRRRKPNAAT